MRVANSRMPEWLRDVVNLVLTYVSKVATGRMSDPQGAVPAANPLAARVENRAPAAFSSARTRQHMDAVRHIASLACLSERRQASGGEAAFVQHHVMPSCIWKHSDVYQRDEAVAHVGEDDLARKELRGVVQPRLQLHSAQLRLHAQCHSCP